MLAAPTQADAKQPLRPLRQSKHCRISSRNLQLYQWIEKRINVSQRAAQRPGKPSIDDGIAHTPLVLVHGSALDLELNEDGFVHSTFGCATRAEDFQVRPAVLCTHALELVDEIDMTPTLVGAVMKHAPNGQCRAQIFCDLLL